MEFVKSDFWTVLLHPLYLSPLPGSAILICYDCIVHHSYATWTFLSWSVSCQTCNTRVVYFLEFAMCRHVMSMLTWPQCNNTT